MVYLKEINLIINQVIQFISHNIHFTFKIESFDNLNSLNFMIEMLAGHEGYFKNSSIYC